MSTKDESNGNSASTSRSESPPVFPLKHQHSFEERYATIINQQILKNTINKEVLQRQVQAFFPFSRTTSRECAEEEEGKKNSTKGRDSEEEKKKEAKNEKILQKLETLDIKDKEET
ncbi:uncharacterized protein ACRADG_010984 [Cochliomyia hominivorax]